MTVRDSIDPTHVELFDRFIHGQLSKSEWTHHAHLVTCWVALQSRTPAETVAFLRDAIKTHNCGIGTANTDTSGYHETLTVYYTAAIADAQASDPTDLNELPNCSNTAARRFWSEDELFSVQARGEWRDPDRAPLPAGINQQITAIGRPTTSSASR